jgi:hypothetical protein
MAQKLSSVDGKALVELRHLLDAAIQFDQAAMGNVQIFDPRKKELRILVQRGFNDDFLSHFRVVKASDASACGRAAGGIVPVVIRDVMCEIGFEPHRAVAQSAGFRSVKSVPIRGEDGRLLGVISTHCRETRGDWDVNSLDDLIPSLATILESPTLKDAPAA